ncbi:inovirus Gp2 family protein [Enterobacter chuandaensis]|uniref:rolling circle replication-associated protein n=1 Tax=Enterobacter chuandaensis TaxID=2497875 RepID=UPI00321699F5
MLKNSDRNFNEDWFLASVLNAHIDEMINRYSCLLAFRMDFFYKKNTVRYSQLNHQMLEYDLRDLMDKMTREKGIVGYFWVIEWTERHGYHAHVVFWLDRQKTQHPYPFALTANTLWEEITHRDGGSHRCEYRPQYSGNINIPVRYNDPESINNIRHVLSYLAKEEQKEGLCAYGCNDVPPRSVSGRPRKPVI